MVLENSDERSLIVRYRTKAKEVARKLAAKPFSAKELLIKHVEFAAEFGEIHNIISTHIGYRDSGPSPALRPQSVDMNIIEYNNMDIIVVFAVSAAIFIFVSIKTSCKIVRRVVGKKSKIE